MMNRIFLKSSFAIGTILTVNSLCYLFDVNNEKVTMIENKRGIMNYNMKMNINNILNNDIIKQLSHYREENEEDTCSISLTIKRDLEKKYINYDNVGIVKTDLVTRLSDYLIGVFYYMPKRIINDLNDDSTSNYPFYIVGINILIFLLWKINPRIGYLHFNNSMFNFKSGRIYTMFTSIFSHYSFFHLFVNCYTTLMFSKLVLEHISSTFRLSDNQYLLLYTSSGLFASFCSLLTQSLRFTSTGALGASGAVFGIFGYAAATWPSLVINILTFKLNIFTLSMINFHAESMLLLASMTKYYKFRIDHSAHLGGFLSSTIACLIYYPYMYKYYKNNVINFYKSTKYRFLKLFN